MRIFQVKNYRTIDYISFFLNKVNVFVGENNTGKTSILKLINSAFSFKSLCFKNTWLKEVNFKDIVKNENEKIDIFMGFYQKNNAEKKSVIFEKLKIGTIKDYNKPLLFELITVDVNYNLVKFEIVYDTLDVKGEVRLKTIKYTVAENLVLNEQHDFDKSFNYSSILDEVFKNHLLKTKDIHIENFEELKIILQNLSRENRENKDKFLETYVKLNLTSEDYGNEIIDIYRLFMIKSKKEINEGILYDRSIRFLNIFNNSIYVDPLRSLFKEFYLEDEYNEISRENKNDTLYNLKYLSTNLEKDYSKNVNKFFEETFSINNLKFQMNFIDQLNKKVYIPVYNKKGSDKIYNLKYSGTGISQIFSIVSLFIDMITKQRIKTLFIEQPEVHLHPKAQIKIGNCINDILKIKNDNSYSNNIFLETHSNLIIDGIRLEIAKEVESKEDHHKDISIFFLYNNNWDDLLLDEFGINKEGQFSGCYDKYLDFLEEHAFEMIGV